VVCYGGTAALLIWALILTGVTTFVRQIIMIAFVANTVNLGFGTAVLTEPLFTVVATAGVVTLILIERVAFSRRSAIAWAVIAYTLVGASFWIRYASLFLIVAVLSYTLLQFLLQRNRMRTICLFSGVIPIQLAGVLMLRNVAATGTWKGGGTEMTVHNPVGRVAANYVRAQFHLVLGEHPVVFGVWECLLLVGGLVIAVLFVAGFRKSVRRKPDGPALLVAFCITIYTAGLVYAGWTTVISFGIRMFVPLFPLYLLALGTGLSWLMSQRSSGVHSALLKAGILVMVAGYVGSNARDLRLPLASSEYKTLAQQYAKPAENGRPLLEWINSNIGPRETIAASEGQATGYLLRRPMLSLIDPTYSPVHWDCNEVKKQMERFGARYLILYKSLSTFAQDRLFQDSHFLSSATSQHPSCGFVVAAENPDVRILTTGVNSP